MRATAALSGRYAARERASVWSTKALSGNRVT